MTTNNAITIKLDAEVTNQFLADILTTAVESGGISYWVEEAHEVRRNGPRTRPGSIGNVDGDSITFISVSDGESDRADVGLESIAQALGKIAMGEVKISPDLRASITRAMLDDDCGEIDAEAADVIVQVAALGEIVYG